ncbi:hypothetical protein [Neorhizobium galegae]|uniref:hypothetical protein n=1 Tax=Neorhizobium galegae TaxID=399 RepID=UPI001F334CF5|nr:hypothetical protein [Neorhizobium galegae]UIK05386.1 hypothetical protein LZK81_22575 [Neorhizobium galegae]
MITPLRDVGQTGSATFVACPDNLGHVPDVGDKKHLGGALSANFDHLKEISPELHRLGVLAERFFAEDANTSLIKSRQFGEYMVKEIADALRRL